VKNKIIRLWRQFLHRGNEIVDSSAQSPEGAIKDRGECLWRGTEQLNRCPGVGFSRQKYLDGFFPVETNKAVSFTRASSSSLLMRQKLG
jgi:hypothetical protein